MDQAAHCQPANYYYNPHMQNIINEQCQLNQHLQQYPNATLTLSILGTQSSGKSTLLNAMAHTNFPVLDTTNTRTRCTRGVWLTHINNINLLDTEGFDSQERSEEDKIFEKQLSLFVVVISDVIMINIYMHEVGRYSGGHLDILEAIFKVGERLVTSQQKKIIYVVRDCTEDADHSILSDQLSKEIKQLSGRYKNKNLKYTIEYHFMSHYIYQPEKFDKEAQALMKKMHIRKPSAINNYQGKDRVQYIRELWKQIKDTKNQIDMMSIDEALKNYVMERLKNQVLQILEKDINQMNQLQTVKSYEKYNKVLKDDIHYYLTSRKPTHMKQKQLRSHCDKVFQFFEPTALKHFNNVALKNIQENLLKQITAEIQGHKKNKKLSHLVFKKKKQVTQIYKKVINGHKQYHLYLKNFTERIDVIINNEQRNLNHLFSIFESKVQNQLNKLVNGQAAKLSFKEEEISAKIKRMCEEYQYKEYQVDFKDIWEKVSYRCIEKLIPQVIEEHSEKSVINISVLSGDQTTNIIAVHTNLQSKVLNFCRNILTFLHEDNTFTQPLSQVKELVRDCLSKRLAEEQRRWKISLLMISFLLLLLYGEFETVLGFTSLKKKKRRLYKRIYLWSSVAFLGFALWKEVINKKSFQKTPTSNSTLTPQNSA